ncbi:hypothetical protein H5410_015612 [Solanum commersonii]|uniref:Uncharacterized protein n=1 Tax=Solanum commersonii TaxID=4109 RepID=A0A9J5ZUX9_SOLCO|nr:hypothetical protein H5410_015612 [Solanum commersonii]
MTREMFLHLRNRLHNWPVTLPLDEQVIICLRRFPKKHLEHGVIPLHQILLCQHHFLSQNHTKAGHFVWDLGLQMCFGAIGCCIIGWINIDLQKFGMVK